MALFGSKKDTISFAATAQEPASWYASSYAELIRAMSGSQPVGTATATAPALARKRLDAPKVDPFTETEREVFARAEAELGYKRPLLPCEKPLYRALDRLGVEPFDAESVRAYKSSKECTGLFQSASWKRVALSAYGKFVPEFAIQRALDVKRECPEATFEVDVLLTRPDPFLVAKCGDEEFYVDVWDEPDFKAKRAK